MKYILIPYCGATLNVLRLKRSTSKISVYIFLNEQHVYDAMSPALPGWQSLVVKDPVDRAFFVSHGVKGFHTCFVESYCRCYEGYVPTT